MAQVPQETEALKVEMEMLQAAHGRVGAQLRIHHPVVFRIPVLAAAPTLQETSYPMSLKSTMPSQLPLLQAFYRSHVQTSHFTLQPMLTSLKSKWSLESPITLMLLFRMPSKTLMLVGTISTAPSLILAYLSRITN